MNALMSLFWFLLAISVLVAVHEWGHFAVARRFGIKVLRFSIGFGRPLWRRQGADGTEYVIAALPLGGYVRMLDEREADVAPEERHRAFNTKPPLVRIAVAAAGPAINLAFALFAFWLMFMVGVAERRPSIDPPRAIAAEAGLREGDEILAVDGRSISGWTQLTLALIGPALDRQAVDLTLLGADGSERELVLPLDRLPDGMREQDLFQTLGLRPFMPPTAVVVGSVVDGEPAALAGLRSGDRILRIDDQPLRNWLSLRDLIVSGQAGAARVLDIERDGQLQQLTVFPAKLSDGAVRIGIGFASPSEAERSAIDAQFLVLRAGPVEALGRAADECVRITSTTLDMLGKMIVGKASLENISGPVGIAGFARSSAELGLARFLYFLGLVSLSLAILNLLPIPVLDGGHILYYLIELIRGRPLSERSQVAGQYVGLAALGSLMCLALFNDISRLLQ